MKSIFTDAQPGTTPMKNFETIRLPSPPKPAPAHEAPLARLAASLARIPSSGRGANSRELFLP